MSKPRGVSASRGAAVLGLSEFQTPLEVWQRIMEEREHGFNARNGYTLPPEPDGAALRWGIAFEDAVVELAEIAQGRGIIHRERFDEAPNMDYVTCHLDGVYSNSNVLIHEGKTTSSFSFREKWGEPGTDRIPRLYQIQVQHQMMCAGADEAIVSVLVFPETPDKWEKDGWVICKYIDSYRIKKEGDKDVYGIKPSSWARVLCEMGYFHQYFIKRNDEVINLLLKHYRDFWENHVLTGKPPEARNYDDVKRLFFEPKSTIIVPDFIERKMLEHRGITEETANAKKRKDRLKTIITKYAAQNIGEIDDESREAVIFRSNSGEKLGSWSKDKNGKHIFRC